MYVTIMTDASMCPETGATGFGFWVACERGKRPGGGPMRTLTRSSNEAEMMAIVNALHQAVKADLVQRYDTVLIQTDSTAAIGAFNGRRAYESLTQGEQRAYDEFHNIRRKVGIVFDFRHVKGHTGIRDQRSMANHMCDKRAKAGMRQARTSIRGQGVFG